jgi:general secretion pathway protein G
MKNRSGFTLVEILIVVVILGILAAIVIPQFSDASEQAKMSSMVSNLQTIRSQLQLYKIQHSGAYTAITDNATFVTAMTSQTEADGSAPEAGDTVYGPYLLKIPPNPFTDACSVDVGTATTFPSGSNKGWYFNNSTGAFNANDTTEHAAY